MDLKRGVDLAVQAIVEELKSKSKKVTNNDEIAQSARSQPTATPRSAT